MNPIRSIFALPGSRDPKNRKLVCDETGSAITFNSEDSFQFRLATSDEGPAPIVDVIVLADSEPLPAGFYRIPVNLIPSSGNVLHLAIQRHMHPSDPAPIVELRFCNASSDGVGWESVIGPLFETEVGMKSLCFRRGQPCSVEHVTFEDEISQLEAGFFVDALTPEGKWQPAVILSTNEDSTVSVIFDNFPSDYELRVPRDGTHLSWEGSLSGLLYEIKQQRYYLGSAATFGKLEHACQEFLEYPFEDPTVTAFIERELPIAVEITSSSGNTPTISENIGDFLRTSIQVVATFLGRAEPVPLALLGALRRCILTDERCDSFLLGNGAVHQLHGGAKMEGVDGDYAMIPSGGASRFWVRIANRFGEHGGWEAIKTRLLDPSISNGEILTYVRVLHMHRFGGTKWFLEKLTLDFVNALVTRSQLDALHYDSETLVFVDKVVDLLRAHIEMLVRRQSTDLGPLHSAIERYQLQSYFVALHHPQSARAAANCLNELLSLIAGTSGSKDNRPRKLKSTDVTDLLITDETLVDTLVGLLVANQASIDEVQLCVSKLLQQTLDSLPESSEQQKHMSMVYITGLVKGLKENGANEAIVAAIHTVLDSFVQQSVELKDVESVRFILTETHFSDALCWAALAAAIRTDNVGMLVFVQDLKPVELLSGNEICGTLLNVAAVSGSLSVIKHMLSGPHNFSTADIKSAAITALRCCKSKVVAHLCDSYGIVPVSHKQEAISAAQLALQLKSLPTLSWIAENVPFSVDFRDSSGYNLLGSLIIDHLKGSVQNRTPDDKRNAVRACLTSGSCFYGSKLWRNHPQQARLSSSAFELMSTHLGLAVANSMADILTPECLIWHQRRVWLRSITAHTAPDQSCADDVTELLLDPRVTHSVGATVMSPITGIAVTFLPHCCPNDDCPRGPPYHVTPKVPAAGEASQPPPDQHGIQPNNYPAAFVDVGDSDDEDYEDDEDDGFW